MRANVQKPLFFFPGDLIHNPFSFTPFLSRTVIGLCDSKKVISNVTVMSCFLYYILQFPAVYETF